MLEASAMANNRSAFTVALDGYKADMEGALQIDRSKFSGSRSGVFVKEAILKVMFYLHLLIFPVTIRLTFYL